MQQNIFQVSKILSSFTLRRIMKNAILATLLSLSTVTALAQTSVTVGGAVADSDVNSQQTHRTSIGVKTTLGQGISGDVAVINSRNDVTKATSVRQEVGVAVTAFETGRLSATVRGAVGVKSVSGADQVEFYSVEPGANFKISQDLTARVAYRYRDAFASSDADRSDTMRYGLSYALTKKDTIGVLYDVVKKDGAEKAYNFSYTRSF
jgi:hypothetical protein